MNQFSTLVMLDTLSEDSSSTRTGLSDEKLSEAPRVCQSLVGAPILAYSAQLFDSAVV